MDHLMRLDRVGHGLTELPVEKRKLERVPEGVLKLIAGFGSTLTQQNMLNEAKKQYLSGTPWAEIEGFLKREMGVA